MGLHHYSEAGFPRIVNRQTVSAAALIDRIYCDNCSGLPLHVVLEDGGSTTDL